MKTDLDTMTKADLLKLAGRRKIKTAKSSLLKSEIIKLIKKDMKKAGKAARKPKPKKTSVTPKKQTTPASRTNSGKTAAKKPARKVPLPKVETHAAPGTSSMHPAVELEDMAQEAKFIVGPRDIHDEGLASPARELPAGYGDNKLVMMVRDPYWVYLYWEITSPRLEEGLLVLGRPYDEVRWVLRVHPVSGPTRDSYDVDIDARATNWYLQPGQPGSSYFTEIGLLDPNGQFYSLATSNTITLPLDGPAEYAEGEDERWMTSDEAFETLYLMSGGSNRPGSGSEQRLMGEQRRVNLSWGISSGQVSSFSAAPIRREQKEREFAYWLDAELILYGGTRPDARVELDGKPVELRPDGTFSMRFALSDGSHRFPITFESADNIEKHTVVPVVTRETKKPKSRR